MAMICEKHNLALASDGKCVLCRRSDRPGSPLITRRLETTGDKVVTIALLVCMVGATGSLIWLLQQRTPVAPRSAIANVPAAPVQPAVAPPPATDAGEAAPVKPTATAAEVSALAKAEQSRARRKRIDEARAAIKVTMFSAQWCTICEPARFYLQAAGVDFEERRIDIDDEADRSLAKINAAKTVPTFTIDEHVLVGYNAYIIEAKIAGIARAAGDQVAKPAADSEQKRP